MSKRSLSALMTPEALGHSVDHALLGVVDAVDEGPIAEGQEVTVGMVGERLGADPSRASRMVAEAVRAGYVVRVASQADGRRIHLELTEAGRDLIRAVRQVRQAFFERLLKDWPERDHKELTRLLTRFSEALATSAATDGSSEW
jgi:DNA-binding MarR family transcriptional regulator